MNWMFFKISIAVRSLRFSSAMALGAVVVWLYTPGGVLSREPDENLAHYAHKAWTRAEGQLPSGVLAMAQTRDGILWLGTDTGLLRFDGVRFQPWKAPPDQGLLDSYVDVLRLTKDGSLWIGTHEGLSHWHDNTLRNFRISKGTGGPRVSAILEDHTGTIWVATAGYHCGGLFRAADQGLRAPGSNFVLSPSPVFGLLEDQYQALWIGGRQASRWSPGRRLLDRYPDAQEIYAIVQAPDGGVWLGGRTLNRLTPGTTEAYEAGSAPPVTDVRALLVDRQGSLWIGTAGHGLFRLFHGRLERFTAADGLSHNFVVSLLEDREGNIWAGTMGGLDQFREYAVSTITQREGLAGNTVSCLFAAGNGDVWVGTTQGLSCVRGHQIGLYGKRDGLPSNNIMGIFAEQSGRLWVVTRFGLSYLDGNHFRPLRLSGEPISFSVAVEDSRHDVWLSDPEHGLLRVHDARVAATASWLEFHNRPAWAIETDSQRGGLWLGFDQGEMAYYRPGQRLVWYRLPPPLGLGPVTDLHWQSDGTLWILTDDGLARWKAGRYSLVTAASSLACKILSILEDNSSAIWLDSGCGLIRLTGADLVTSQSLRGHFHPRLYDFSDGIRGSPSASGYFRRAAKSPDGRLYFATYNGVAVVDPKSVPENRIPPPVTIGQLVADNKNYAANVKLPPQTKETRFEYTAITFLQPDKVRFRYRLAGFENEWHETADRHAVYNGLPPGDYQFEVMACNNDGIWNSTAAVRAVSIQRAFYQAKWFWSLTVGSMILLLWSLHRYRLARLANQMNDRCQQRMDERTRIARDMHDGLLQNLSGTALQLTALSKDPRLPSHACERLREVREDMEECAREARQFVWDLRTPVLEEWDLPRALSEVGQRITNGQPLTFQMNVAGNRQPVPAEVRLHLVRIFQEAARNAVRYSQAKEIQVNITYLDSCMVKVQMRDDGCGFDVDQACHQLGHWGLTTMRERARQIGADFNISSLPGQGTEVDVVAPLVYPSS